MTIYLYGLNEVSLEILENPDWPTNMPVKGLINKRFFDKAKDYPVEIKLVDDLEFQEGDEVINCIGYKSLQSREEASNAVSKIRTYISPRATVSRSAKIMNGVVILGNAIVERGVTIGDGCLLWGGSYICHDASIGSYNFIASGVRIGGWARTGKFCKFGFNTVVEQHSQVPEKFSSGALSFYKNVRNTSVYPE